MLNFVWNTWKYWWNGTVNEVLPVFAQVLWNLNFISSFPWEIVFCVTSANYLCIRNCKTDCKTLKIILVPDFCPLKPEITRFSIGLILTYFKIWNRHFWAYRSGEIKTFFSFPSEIDIRAITRYPEINFQIFLELRSTFLSLFVAWNKNLVPFEEKWTFLPLRVTLKLTFTPFLDSALPEMGILAVTGYLEINIQTFCWAEIDIFELVHCLK